MGKMTMPQREIHDTNAGKVHRLRHRNGGTIKESSVVSVHRSSEEKVSTLRKVDAIMDNGDNELLLTSEIQDREEIVAQCRNMENSTKL